ncbi:hypothetical protein [Roseomonas genomospecies 6]|uniref:Uncharacterized protein n=1 Tax=Roseomonas genomospecies 6 TaxID=214106 RepID=A0A9W7KQD5_9PROT|nr:hypothetical protein [Roseomonas genomospecies 6]KAA0677626.1 hypothetical protein DS843_22565 [Roseomonas genomospecies 6]
MTKTVFLAVLMLSAAATPAYAIYDTRDEAEQAGAAPCSYACLQSKVEQLEEQMSATREGAAVAQAQLAIANQRLFAIERALLGEASDEFPIHKREPITGWIIPEPHDVWVVPDRAKKD